jgi:hypothetical protein
MRTLLLCSLIAVVGCHFAYSQYPFEKFPTPKYQIYGRWKEYDRIEKEGKFHWTQTVCSFYPNDDSVTIQISTFASEDYSLIRIFRNRDQTQVVKEPHSIGGYFGMLEDSIYIADINGDSLMDIKILAWYGGNGTASMHERVIYLFQQPDNSFTKISYRDRMPSSRREYDFNNDGNFEIITMTLDQTGGHSYFTFHLYNFKNNTFESVSAQHDYPIMIQFLYRRNYEITNKVSREKMKDFKQKQPEGFDVSVGKSTGNGY